MTTNEKALMLHEQWQGKLSTEPKAPVNSREDLSLAYTPGVAEPCKVIAIELHDLDKLERFRLAIMEKYSDTVTTVYSNPNYLEIFMKESGKGSAVKRLAEYLDVPISNTYAAGDEKNDISMIEAAGCGIAMINASDEVKAYADVVTKADNNHDGLEELIRSAI